MFKNKRKIKNLSIKENEIIKNDVNNLNGYYNQEYLLKSEGTIIRDNTDNFKIDLIINDNILTSLYGLFDYVNIPNEIPIEKIEEYLFYSGSCMFFELGGKYYVTRYISSGVFDEYGRETKIQPIYENGKVGSLREVGKECIIIYNSFGKLSTYKKIEPFIKRMSLLFEVSSGNLKSSMTKWLIKVRNLDPKKIKIQVEQLLNKNGRIAVLGGEIGEVDESPLFEEFDSSKYWEDFNECYNFIYSLIGVNSNPNEDKKERLIVDEININNNKVGLILEGMFKARNKSLKKINELYNLNIKLNMYVNYKEGEKENENNFK